VNWLLRQPGLQGIILCPADTTVGQKLVQKCLEHRVICVAVDESIPATISVRSGNRDGGRQAAEIFQAHVTAPALLGVFVDRALEVMIRRLEGFRQQAEKGAFEVVEIYCDLTDGDKVRDYILSGLEAHPDLRGIFLPSGTVTLAYLSLIHERRVAADRLLAVGYDRTSLVEEAIRNGELLGAIFQHPEEIGKQAFYHLHRLIKKQIRIDDVDERTMYISTVQVTRDLLSQMRDA
jgi:ABC-type sugar transport system substrate-binding protein